MPEVVSANPRDARKQSQEQTATAAADFLSLHLILGRGGYGGILHTHRKRVAGGPRH